MVMFWLLRLIRSKGIACKAHGGTSEELCLEQVHGAAMIEPLPDGLHSRGVITAATAEGIPGKIM